MKIFKFLFKLLLLLIGLFITFSCDHSTNRFEAFLIKVDSISIPQAISSGTPFNIGFFGTIGGDGCHTFKEFKQTSESNNIILEAWGNLDVQSTACTTVMMFLGGRSMPLTIQTPGVYNLKVKQPDNTFLIRQITVN